MKNNSLRTIITKPVEIVFDYTLDPVNIPKWISSVTEAMRHETPTRLHTTYLCKFADGTWSRSTVTDFTTNALCTLSQDDGPYRVRYYFTAIDSSHCLLEVHEYVDTGVIAQPLDQTILLKLKELIEKI